MEGKTQPKGQTKAELLAQNRELAEKAGELSAKFEEYKSLLQRLQADFDNYRKRAEKDRAEYKCVVVGDVALKFIDAYENLLNAVDYAQKDANCAKLLAGIKGVSRQMESALKEDGVERIKTVGSKFDPALHEAADVVESDAEDGLIVEEIRSGYAIRDRILRTAKVVVNKKKEVVKNA